jgi:hypothetical protein
MVNEEIRNDDWLLRRLSPDSHFKTDKRTVTRGVFRVNSELDKNISVHVQLLLYDPNNP